METSITNFRSTDFPKIIGAKGDLNTEDVDMLTLWEQNVRNLKLENDELENANCFTGQPHQKLAFFMICNR